MPDAYSEPSPEYWHALLIGIAYADHDDPRVRLNGPHRDLHLMERLLLARGWLESNIVILSDEKAPGQTYREPTRANILDALNALVRPAIHQPEQCHKFLFYYAGHGAEEPDPKGLEEDGLNECIVPMRSDITRALNLDIQASPAPSTPAPAPAPIRPPRSPFRISSTGRLKLPTLNWKLGVRMIKGWVRGARTRQRNDPEFRPFIRKKSSEPKLGAPMQAPNVSFESYGWITDDTLRELLCAQLPGTCRLSAIFDMSHSGTPLDLPFNYTWRSVPIRLLWSFNWIEAYVSPEQRNTKRWLWRTPQIVDNPPSPISPTTSTFRSRIRRMRSMPAFIGTRAGLDGGQLGDTPTPAPKPLDTSRSMKRASISSLTARLFRQTQATAAVGFNIPDITPLSQHDEQPGLRPMSPALSVNTAQRSQRSYGTVFQSPAISLRSVAWEPATSSETGLEEVEDDIDSIYFTADESANGSTLSRSIGMPSTSTVHLENTRLPISNEAPVMGGIICIGACRDEQLADDNRSMAKLLVELYDTFDDHPTLYQLILWLTRRARKPQIPQLSSNLDLSQYWQHLFLI